ncbi:MAG: hypothetical protein AVDCRST_MAG38-2511 [uncultured Solirubrobacteraceae bacterium]|uniref:Uncharacterized protein n=1 Tax=uncultured Solirubrobacteraceae bacterium TaxID=1162706 RepID=A0A6J4S3M6_9ACTN|nr:MAG: hypothetical protein AVDCRST_MAG38-2511 [uncultured Solirubrobacteraceae bacterium]
MPASSGNRRNPHASRQHPPLTPAGTAPRRGSHAAAVAGPVEPARTLDAVSAPGLTLIRSARGVRLSKR